MCTFGPFPLITSMIAMYWPAKLATQRATRLLNSGEIGQVAEAKRERNLLLCEAGSTLCDRALPTPQNAKEMNGGLQNSRGG